MAIIAFIGLGVMGGPMAGHLSDKGHELRAYNRTRAKSETWLKQYGDATISETAADAALGADFVISCVSTGSDLMALLAESDHALLRATKSNAIFIDHSTTSADEAKAAAALCENKELCEHNERSFVDAPVSGGEQGAINAALSIMCGGRIEAFHRAESIMQHYAKKTTHLGANGAGQLCKMVNQICVAGVIQSLSEGIQFAETVGLDTGKAMQVIAGGAAQSWQLEHRHQSMIEGHYDHGFAVDLMRKDLDICLSEASKQSLDLPITEIINGYYQEIQAMGLGQMDTSSLLKRMQDRQQDK